MNKIETHQAIFPLRADEPAYAYLWDKDARATNRYGNLIELVAADSELRGDSLHINGNPEVGGNPNRYKQHGFFFNADNCIGCHACESACSEKNDNPAHIAFRSVGYVEGGTFPDYQRIIPKDCQTRVVLPVAEFLHATKTASVFSRDNSNIVRLTVKPSGEELAPGQVEVQASSAEMGDNVGQLDASVEGEEVQIAFNVLYLRAALEAVSGGEVALEISGPQSPGLLKPVAETGHLHVIMPMHISR